ncbi:hypothetical protein GCM10010968_11150 [Agrococcus terreus]|uniref:Uncharacterized protein n=1 Tax=Agrococcus terreus TaxID=574649 RepID=A0ABQ2KFG5_9MICO|nr:hypothetical protein GCM10010968_11150 [Agrococcus terreus]
MPSAGFAWVNLPAPPSNPLDPGMSNDQEAGTGRRPAYSPMRLRVRMARSASRLSWRSRSACRLS